MKFAVKFAEAEKQSAVTFLVSAEVEKQLAA